MGKNLRTTDFRDIRIKELAPGICIALDVKEQQFTLQGRSVSAGELALSDFLSTDSQVIGI